MRARNLCILHVVAMGAFGVAFACTGDDVTYGPESGPPKSDATADQTAPDGGDAGTTLGPRLLMTYSGTEGELVAFDTQADQVAGRMSFPGYGAVVHSGADTFLLETSADVVAKLDPASLTSAVASWNVALSDGGGENADPVGVVEVAANKAYVLRYNRNAIAVLDPSQTSDAGVPTSTIDLSSLVQSADGDGHVDMSGAVYDASRHRVYVVLGNVDLTTVQPPTYDLLCVATKMTMTAIDTTTDSLVSLGGSGPGGSVELDGYNPQMGYYGGVQLDVSGDRVLVVSLGCNPSTGDGGVGGVQQRIVEAVDLQTNTTSQLLDANAKDYPNVFRLVDSTQSIIQFGDFAPFITTYAWNPSQSTLGAPFATAPDVFDYDPSGSRMLGPQSTFDADGGAGPVNVIAVSYPGGAVTQLGQNPFLQTGGYLGNALYVP